MKAITICQPYASLIMLPSTDSRFKRCENRTWPAHWRGPLAIHAGKSKKYIEHDDSNPGHDIFEFKISELPMGCILGVVDFVACYTKEQIQQGKVWESHRWLKSHQHCEGPWCHIYLRPRLLAKPIPYFGALGFFDVPDEWFTEVMTAEEYIHLTPSPRL